MSRFAAPLLLALLGTGWLAIAGCASTSPTNETRDETGDEAGQADVLRVATWNIKHGRGMDGRLDLERTATVLAALKADIIALQEVDETVRRSGRVDQAAWLAARLGMHASFGAFMDYQGGRYGLAILSRFPIEHAETWRLTDGNEPRVAQAIRVALPSGDVITGVCVHFDWVDDDGFRFAQASETMARLRELDTPWIVLGDFNDTPDSRTMRGFHALGRDARKPSDAPATFPADDPRIEIDFIVTGPGDRWAVDRVEVIAERIASDHRPVIAVLRPPLD